MARPVPIRRMNHAAKKAPSTKPTPLTENIRPNAEGSIPSTLFTYRSHTASSLEVWMEFGGEPEADRRATARGLREGGKVRIAEGGLRAEINGKVGTLLQFTVGTIEVEGKRYSIGLKDLEPLDGPTEAEATERKG